MKNYLLLSILLAGHITTGQVPYEGSYTAFANGDKIHLQLNRKNPKEYTGFMKDSYQEYQVTAEVVGDQLTGTATETVLGITFQLQGLWKDDKLKLVLQLHGSGETLELLLERDSPILQHNIQTKQEQSATSSKFTFPAGAQHDPMITGSWTREEIYNSGYGDNYMGTTHRETIIFYSNGTLGDGGSQSTMSGSDYLGQSSSGTKKLPDSHWYTLGNQLYIATMQNGQMQNLHLGKYFIENDNMLITSPNGRKTLLRKQ